MRLTHLELTNHRNITHAELNPDPHLTVLCGPNGPVTGVHGWMRRIDRADDSSFAKLIVQIARQAMQGAT